MIFYDRSINNSFKNLLTERCFNCFVCSLFFIFSLSSCNQVKLSDAREQYVNGEYHIAAESYRSLYRSSREQPVLRGIIAFEMAEANRKLNRTSRAVSAYRNAIKHNYPDTLMHLHYAQMLHKEGNYIEAIEAYEDYLKLDPTSTLAINGIKGAEQSILWLEKPSLYKVENAELFNSSRSEFSPMLNHSGDILYFTSSRNSSAGDNESPVTGAKYNDIFVSSKNVNGEWQIPESLSSEINSEFDEGTASFTIDGQFMFYTYSHVDSDKSTRPEIYFSRKVNGIWTSGKRLDIVPENDYSTFAHPAVSPSGDYLYFVSDMPGGYGGMDIWKAVLSPTMEVISYENCGAEINSPGNEMFPYIKDNKTIYFSSDGHPGMGGLDLFESRFYDEAGQWRIENMGYPINSSSDDFGITFFYGKDEGFFSSNREDVRGFDNIYYFRYHEASLFVEGIVVDQNDDFIYGALVSVVGSDGVQRTLSTNRMGEYGFVAERGVDYLFMASAEGFLNKKQYLKIDVAERDTLYYVDFEMISYNEPVVLEQIFYDFDSDRIRPESTDQLDELVELMDEYPEIQIELLAHTDRNGSVEYNKNLSERRANSVLKYLVNKGINEKRLTKKGYGMDVPKTVNRSLSEQYSFLNVGDVLTKEFIENLTFEEQEIADQINRRTEFKVLKP